MNTFIDLHSQNLIAMASTALHNRFNNDQPLAPIRTKPASTMPKQDLNKSSKAKRALRSLAIGIAIPLALTTTTILLFGSNANYRATRHLTTPLWLPPLWLIHVASLSSSFLMGLSSWLVWADGGFHAQSNSHAFFVYIAQIALSILWEPIALVVGAAWLGLVLCLMHFGALFGCYKLFRCVNPFAKDLVKPCLAWVAYLSAINCKLVCLGF